jgi:hypothetical protein
MRFPLEKTTSPNVDPRFNDSDCAASRGPFTSLPMTGYFTFRQAKREEVR